VLIAAGAGAGLAERSTDLRIIASRHIAAKRRQPVIVEFKLARL
jgi:hypothetical protein